MNKINNLLCVILFCSSFISNAHSRSFFRPRDISTDSTLELSQTNYHRYHSTDAANWRTFFFKPFYMRSQKSRALARYFLPNNQLCATLNENGYGDIDPLWLNLISAPGSFYSSTITLAPQRSVAGVLFTFYVNFCKKWWVGINSAAISVTTNAHLCEINQAEPGAITGFANAYDAFNNPAWNAGKISNRDQTKGGLDDIQLKFGYDFYKTDEQHATLYLVATAPTGTHPKSRYLFEPLVGSNHGSFGMGFDSDFLAWQQENYTINIMADLKYRYIFSATERRSFDLCQNGDWSRYLLVVTQAEPLNSQPAINLLTLPARVTPASTLDFWIAAHYQWCATSFEIGYELWWRQSEKICQNCPIAQGFALQTLNLCTQPITSASTATICQAASGTNITISDAQFTPLVAGDLNLNSAAQPHALSNKLYATVGYSYQELCSCRSWLFGMGGSYEFANKNALQQWALWFTMGLTF